MKTGFRRIALGAAALFCILGQAAVAASDHSSEAVEHAVLSLDAARDMDDLSRDLWPDWKISETCFAVYDDDAFCVLLNHSDPPNGFEGERTAGRPRIRFEVGTLRHPAPETGVLNDVTTAYVPWDELAADPVPCVFEGAFQAHLRGECADLRQLLPPIDGYPLTPENLALSDIECDLLMRASGAPKDSLETCVLEFMAVRNYRRLTLSSPAAVAYEEKLERLEGMSAYIGMRARAEAATHVKERDAELLGSQRGEPFNPEACMSRTRDLEWYRHDRYKATGAVLCGLLDRFDPAWRKDAGPCPDPNARLLECTQTRLPRAFEVLMRYRWRDRVDERSAFIESLKSDAERLFDDIVKGERKKIVINTGLLASSSVSYDPQNVVQVDDHRFVHKRILKIEFSGGTRVHVTGLNVATNVGEDEFDIEQLTLAAPDDCVVRIGGRQVELAPGVNQFDEPLSVSAKGLLIEARSGVIMAAEDKITFMLHR